MPATVKDKMRAIKAHEEGMPCGKIAEMLEVGETTVRRWVNPVFRAEQEQYKREWAKRNRHRYKVYQETRVKKNRCRSCKQPGSYKDGALCMTCRGEERHFRRVDIQRLWNEEGLTAAQIAEAVGSPYSYIKREIITMRNAGWEMKRRNAVPKNNRAGDPA